MDTPSKENKTTENGDRHGDLMSKYSKQTENSKAITIVMLQVRKISIDPIALCTK